MRNYAIFSDRPVSRPIYTLSAMSLLYFLMRISDGGIIPVSITLGHVLYAFLALVSMFLWTRAISGRLLALRISRVWMLPYVLLVACFVGFFANRNSFAVGVSATAVLVLQLPLMLLPSRQ